MTKIGIIGAGHNSLVAAAYLAGWGFEVDIYEKSSKIGGMCVTEEIFPGYHASSVASFYGMLRREIVKDLALENYGLEPYVTDPAEIILLGGRHYMLTPRGDSAPQYKISNLKDSDLSGWKQFWKEIGEAAKIIYPYYFKPETTTSEIEQVLRESSLNRIADTIFKSSLVDLFSQYFQNEDLQAAASTCTPGYANHNGSVFGCIHHGTAETCGIEGAWGMVKGGMGGIAEALSNCCTARGVNIHTEAEVESITPEKNSSLTLKLADQRFFNHELVISGADLAVTFGKLLKDNSDCEDLNAKHLQAPPPVSAGKIHFALNEIPKFPVLEEAGHNYTGIIVSAPAMETLLKDSHRVLDGELPKQLMMTMAFPSLTDEKLAPEGKHLFNLDIHQLPTSPKSGDWDLAFRKQLLDLAIENIEKLAPRFSECIESSYVITPKDLATAYGAESRTCWHLPLTTHPFEKRNLSNLEAYRTPIENLYLCGSGSYGGGNVTGVSGFNCAKAIAKSVGLPANASSLNQLANYDSGTLNQKGHSYR